MEIVRDQDRGKCFAMKDANSDTAYVKGKYYHDHQDMEPGDVFHTSHGVFLNAEIPIQNHEDVAQEISRQGK